MRVKISEKAIATAADVLRRGGVVAYPTDTLYGLAVDPRSDEAVERLFRIKERDAAQAIPLIAADQEQAEQAAELTGRELRLVRDLWPGPLTLIVPASDSLSARVRAADGTVAIRVPALGVACDLARAFGFCVTATSANVSGQPATASPDDVAAALGDRIDLLLDAGHAPGGAPSTIIRLRDDGPVLVRAGAVAWERVLESLK